MKINLINTFLFVFAIIFSSCVGTKKYNSALSEIARMKVDSSTMAYQHADASYDRSEKLLETSKELRVTKVKLDSIIRQSEATKANLDKLIKGLNESIPNLDNENLEVYMDRGYLHLGLPHRVLFNSGEQELRKEAEDVMHEISSMLQSEDMDIMILGHTDSVPYVSSEKDNWQLSLERAHAVMMVMLKNGIPADRIILGGRGSSQPFMDNDTQVGRLLNRRIELVLIPDIDNLQSLLNTVLSDSEISSQ